VIQVQNLSTTHLRGWTATAGLFGLFLDDLDRYAADVGDTITGVARIGERFPDERELGPGHAQRVTRAVTILNASRLSLERQSVVVDVDEDPLFCGP
jgi:hypothetical protein